MTSLVHILGSPISHHNETVLKFFQAYYTQFMVGEPPIEFLVAVDSLSTIDVEDFTKAYPNLNIQCYEGKKALAQALRANAQAHPQTRYFLHGQFNPTLWFDILFGKIDGRKISWHVWGADLYEEEKTLKYKLFYILRRLAQAKIGHIYATKGDIRVLKSRMNNPNAKTLYFPTKMNLSLTPSAEIKQARLERLQQKTDADCKTILLGNSGDKTNNHLIGLTKIHQAFGLNVKIIIPMGYPKNNDDYINKVKQHANALFPDNQVTILEDKLAFETYLKCLDECDLAYFLFERQQGIGTICLCIQLGIPFVLHPLNAFIDDLNAESIAHLTTKTPITYAHICETQEKLNTINLAKVAFLEPNYIEGWHHALGLEKEDARDIN